MMKRFLLQLKNQTKEIRLHFQSNNNNNNKCYTKDETNESK